MRTRLAAPFAGVGDFVGLALAAARELPRRPFQARETVEQSWAIARVSMVPTLLVAIPFTVLVSFTLNILLREIGAQDLSGAGAALGTITQIGPIVTVLIVAGAVRPPSAPTSGHAPSARRSTPCGCSASTRSTASSSPA